MRLPGLFAPVALFLSLAFAGVMPAPRKFLLKTVVHPGEDMAKNGLYLGMYHTNPGADDLVLRPHHHLVEPVALVLNGTILQCNDVAGKVKTAQMHMEGFEHGIERGFLFLSC